MVKIKRIYDAPGPEDGKRILVDRLWPRGVKKADAKIDEWLLLRLVRNPSERFQTSWNDNHKERDLSRTTLAYENLSNQYFFQR